MRLSILLVVVIWPALALARPRVAVAPLDGDRDGKIGVIVHDAAASQAKVTSSKVVAKALKELSISEPDTSHAAKKLRKHLEVDAVIYGKLERDGTKKKLKLSVYTRGKKPDRFEIEYSKSSSKAFREQLRDELATRLAPEDNSADDADETVTAHKHANDSTVETDRNGVTQAAVFVDAGIGGVHRALTYVASTGGTTPPRVGTGAFAVQLDGEVYPAAFDSLEGTAPAIGVYGSINKVVGLTIDIPSTPQSAPISETSYALGVRYRFMFGQSSLAAGLGYWSQSFIADRSTLTSPTQLNMADTVYKAIGPDVLLRLAVSPTVGLTVQADLPLMFSSGPITEANYFGIASITSFAVQVGVDVALDRHYGLHFAGFFNQESLAFQAGMVSSATDRTMGVSGAFAVMY
ncbi:MAG: hypothetical protein ABI591_12430 [Kofleriaceae bacterium]